MHRRPIRALTLTALVLLAAATAAGCGGSRPGACSPGIDECLSRCPPNSSDTAHQHPTPGIQNTESPCQSACRSQYCH